MSYVNQTQERYPYGFRSTVGEDYGSMISAFQNPYYLYKTMKEIFKHGQGVSNIRGVIYDGLSSPVLGIGITNEDGITHSYPLQFDDAMVFAKSIAQEILTSTGSPHTIVFSRNPGKLAKGLYDKLREAGGGGRKVDVFLDMYNVSPYWAPETWSDYIGVIHDELILILDPVRMEDDPTCPEYYFTIWAYFLDKKVEDLKQLVKQAKEEKDARKKETNQ